MVRDVYGALRSIPARAGEPLDDTPSENALRIYPRACGEPPCSKLDARTITVYPRACGGTETTVGKPDRR